MLSEQLLPGTFEHALNHLLDHELELSGFAERFCNDETGAPAYPPAVLLKLILFAYFRGIVCSRPIEQTCRENVVLFTGRVHKAESHTEKMKRKIDCPRSRACYGRRIVFVEPVFANIRHNTGLDRFTLRGRQKVDTQWQLFCLVHNIEKLANHGCAQRKERDQEQQLAKPPGAESLVWSAMLGRCGTGFAHRAKS